MTPFSLPDFRLNSDDNSISHFPDLAEKNTGAWRDGKGKTFALIQLIDDEYWIHWLDLASFHLKIDKNCVYGHIAKDKDPELVEDVYQRNILPYFLHLSGYEVLHASAIRTDEGVIAFCALSGSGKSTLAYAMARLGHELWSDDALIIATSSAPIQVYKIPFYTRLLPDAYEFLVNETNDQQPAGRKPPAAPGSPTNNKTEAELSKIIFIERRNETGSSDIPKIRRLPPTQAFPLLIRNAYVLEIEDDIRKKRMLENYLELASRVESYQLEYPSNLSKFSDIITILKNIIYTKNSALS